MNDTATYEYVIQTYSNDYYGWEDVGAYATRDEAKEDLAAYRANQPEYPHRMIRRKEEA